MVLNEAEGVSYELFDISELDEMALVGIISTQIIYKNFIDDFQNSYDESDTFDKFFDYRSVNEKLKKVN